MNGEELVEFIAVLLEAEYVRCYDAEILNRLSTMSQAELLKLIKSQ